MRMTAQRKQILDILKQANHPLSAEMIMNKLPEDTLNLSTIYRSLDLFFCTRDCFKKLYESYNLLLSKSKGTSSLYDMHQLSKNV